MADNPKPATQVAVPPTPPRLDAGAVEKVLLQGDLGSLSPANRVQYYQQVCDSLGLNPLTKPFEYLSLNNRLVLYATRNCSDQLRYIHKISVQIVSREKVGDVYVVTARAKTPDGREDESTGAVAVGKSYGDVLANAYMKAETKAKRRVTLSICGLSLLDETEVESIPAAEPVRPPEVVASAPAPKQTVPTPTQPKSPTVLAALGKPVTEPQIARLFAISRARGWNNAQVKAAMIELFRKEATKELTRGEYDQLIGYIENVKPSPDADARQAAQETGFAQQPEGVP